MSLFFVCMVTGFMVVSTIGILLPAIREELQLTPGQQGILGSAAFWGNITLTVPLSWWTSRFRPKPLTSVTLAMGVLVLFIQGWAPVFVVLLLGRLAFGIIMIAREPARALLIQQWFPPREIILANGIGNSMFGIVVGGGLLATPFILDAVGDDWRRVLHLYGGLFLVLTLIWMALGRERAMPEQRQTGESWRAGTITRTAAHRDLWIGGFGFLGATLAWSAFLSFFPTLVRETYLLSLRWAGGILALSILIGGVAGAGLSYAVMTWGRRNGILQVLGLIMVASYAGMTLTGSLPLLMSLGFLNGVAWGFYPILLTVPFQLPGICPREIVVAVAITMTMTSIGTGLGPLVTGFLQEALGDLKPALLVVSFGGLSLSAAGTFLRSVPGTAARQSEIARDGRGSSALDGTQHETRD